MTIGPTGYWIGTPAEKVFDTSLSNALIDIVRGASVIDVGCGPGDYVRHMRACGIDACGFDGNPDVAEVSGGLCNRFDFATPCQFEPRDWVVSLEVGEHIPKRFEGVFLENLHALNRRGIVLSWAVPGQPGIGHVNCLPNAYLIEHFTRLGYALDSAQTDRCRSCSRVPWFKNTLMVLRRCG